MFSVCLVVEQEPYVVHQDLESCKAAAFVQVKKLLVSLEDKPVVIEAFCLDVTKNSI
jgi:hypothetical protein